MARHRGQHCQPVGLLPRLCERAAYCLDRPVARGCRLAVVRDSARIDHSLCRFVSARTAQRETGRSAEGPPGRTPGVGLMIRRTCELLAVLAQLNQAVPTVAVGIMDDSLPTAKQVEFGDFLVEAG